MGFDVSRFDWEANAPKNTQGSLVSDKKEKTFTKVVSISVMLLMVLSTVIDSSETRLPIYSIT